MPDDPAMKQLVQEITDEEKRFLDDTRNKILEILADRDPRKESKEERIMKLDCWKHLPVHIQFWYLMYTDLASNFPLSVVDKVMNKNGATAGMRKQFSYGASPMACTRILSIYSEFQFHPSNDLKNVWELAAEYYFNTPLKWGDFTQEEMPAHRHAGRPIGSLDPHNRAVVQTPEPVIVRVDTAEPNKPEVSSAEEPTKPEEPMNSIIETNGQLIGLVDLAAKIPTKEPLEETFPGEQELKDFVKTLDDTQLQLLSKLSFAAAAYAPKRAQHVLDVRREVRVLQEEANDLKKQAAKLEAKADQLIRSIYPIKQA